MPVGGGIPVDMRAQNLTTVHFDGRPSGTSDIYSYIAGMAASKGKTIWVACTQVGMQPRERGKKVVS
jgi:hypothetical protein